MHTDEYDEDYEEERAIVYRAILDEEDKLLHHSSWKGTAPSIDRTSWPSIDTQPQQRCQKRASIKTAYYKSVDTDFNHVRDGDYLIGSWADEHHHESFAVETEPKLTSNTKPDTTACLVTWYTWDRILQTSLKAVPEATRKNTCYSQKILLTWNARSAKINVPHRSTQ
ncbi:hypothetical protein DY000_02023496 [Brassica cretica]|uniref:Uncharacterized protein n=1 Tax=Brassica cretica TaxID=69181 RepID=A0ABQ7E9H8_BRACR|nr:hypothetical protein DY000_02023496 [Brassica cretica]